MYLSNLIAKSLHSALRCCNCIGMEIELGRRLISIEYKSKRMTKGFRSLSKSRSLEYQNNLFWYQRNYLIEQEGIAL